MISLANLNLNIPILLLTLIGVVGNKIDGLSLLSEDFDESLQKELIPCIGDRLIFIKVLRELK
jgi:hypothetical protein